MPYAESLREFAFGFDNFGRKVSAKEKIATVRMYS